MTKIKRNKVQKKIYLTHNQLHIVTDKINASGFSFSDYVVKAALGTTIKNRRDFNPKTYKDFLNTGNNLNQLAKHLNQQGTLDQETQDNIKEALRTIKIILTDLA